MKLFHVSFLFRMHNVEKSKTKKNKNDRKVDPQEMFSKISQNEFLLSNRNVMIVPKSTPKQKKTTARSRCT